MSHDGDLEAAIRKVRQERKHLSDGDLILWLKVENDHTTDFQVRAKAAESTASIMTEPPKRRG